MNTRLYFPWAVLMTTCIVWGAGPILPLAPEERRLVHQITIGPNDDIPGMLQSVNARWAQRTIDPRSNDYALLAYLRGHPELARNAVDQLIDLADLLEPVPYSINTRRRKLDLSPAGKVLVALGDDAEVSIGRWLHLHFEEASNRREVLLQCFDDIKTKRLANIETERQKKERAEKRDQSKVLNAANPASIPVVISREDPFAQASLSQPAYSWSAFAAGAVSSAVLIVFAGGVYKSLQRRRASTCSNQSHKLPVRE